MTMTAIKLDTDREPDGYLMVDCPEDGLLRPLGYWLPPGVCPFALGLAEHQAETLTKTVVRGFGPDGTRYIEVQFPPTLEHIEIDLIETEGSADHD